MYPGRALRGAAMPARLRSAGLAPTLPMTLLTLMLCVVLVRLGIWQWQRWLEQDAAWTRFAQGADAVQPLGTRSLEEVAKFQRVSVSGRLDGAHQFLLDNRSYRGRPGYDVLTPLARADGSVLLIDRGWVPFTGSRAHLPDVGLPENTTLTVSGRVVDLPAGGLASGRAAPRPEEPWPKVTSFPAPEELARALAVPITPRILLLDASAPLGFVRDWQPPGISPLRHLSYAIQWWCFAALAAVVWLIMSRRRALR